MRVKWQSADRDRFDKYCCQDDDERDGDIGKRDTTHVSMLIEYDGQDSEVVSFPAGLRCVWQTLPMEETKTLYWN